MSVLACVVSWQNRALTERCINALRNQTVEVDIAVWDNASTDGTPEWLSEQTDLQVVLSPENVYWTPGINGLVEKFLTADHEAIMMVNNDAAPSPTCTARLLDLLRSDPNIGLVAPATARIGGPQDVANCDTHDVMRAGGDPEQLIVNLPPKRCTFVLGACSMVKRTAWDEVGPLDYDMPLGADDHDYSRRVTAFGYQIWVAQNALCDHEGHASENAGGKRHWDDLGGKCWSVFNTKWSGYSATDDEEDKAHFNGNYFGSEWEIGTGWSDQKLHQMGLPSPEERAQLIQERADRGM